MKKQLNILHIIVLEVAHTFIGRLSGFFFLPFCLLDKMIDFIYI